MADTKIAAATSTTPAYTDLIPMERPGSAVARQATVAAIGRTTAYYYNVMHYGAVADGATDDRTAIQAAITAANAAGGGTVFFPAGTYHIHTNPLSMDGMSKIRVIGEGGASIIDHTGNDFRAFDLRNSSHVTIEDITFTSTLDTTLRSACGAVVTDNTAGNYTDYIAIRNCRFLTMGGDAIHIGPNTSHVIIEGCMMDGGLGFIEIVGNTATGPVYDVSVQNNILIGSIPGCGLGGSDASDDMIDMAANIAKISVCNNILDGRGTQVIKTFGHGIAQFGGGFIGDTGEGYDFCFANNILRNFTSDGTVNANQSAIMIYDGTNHNHTHKVSITGNVIENARYGVYLYFTDTAVVSGNTIDADYDAILISNTTAGLACQNVISGAGHVGIYSETSHHCMIVNNRVTVENAAYGIYIASDHCSASGNSLSGGDAAAQGIYVAGNQNILLGNVAIDIPGKAIHIGSGTANWVYDTVYHGNGADLDDDGISTVTR